MKKIAISLFLILIGIQFSYAQEMAIEKEIKELSKAKWQWMADKNVEKLAELFHDKSKFVHMSGTWNKNRELEIIETGSIWYKQADVHDVVVEIFDNTAVLWNRITLIAHVRGNDVSNEFTVTEIYKKEGEVWKLLDLTFSKVRDTHKIAPNATNEEGIIKLSKQKW
ncbi:nuclear transport factor 2 family protein [Flavobacteriaceae bacterium]|nr:nuclear transport factor 2 family protein [Flavobacteriaceae bacterium]